MRMLNSGRPEEGASDTIISLIPKVKNPSKAEEFRPISLCNMINKTVTKVLANRLRLVLPDLISDKLSPEQNDCG